MRRRLRRAGAVVLATALVLWIGWRVFRALVGSPLEALRDSSWTDGTRVLARDGRVLGERPSPQGLRGRTTRLVDVSPRLVLATVVSEDRRFWTHDGVDRVALARAAGGYLHRRRFVSGASTITQQLVKRLDHQGRPRPRSLSEKVREMARAENLEAQVDKEAILEAYLNHIEYGHGWVGPEAAAQSYFGVSAREVSLAQAALLAVLPRAPSALDPHRHLDRAVLRQRALLVAMFESGAISAEDRDRALAEPLVVLPYTPRAVVAPHVVLASAANAPRAGEHVVHTTLDFDLERDVEAIVKAHRARLAQHGATNAAVVVVDNATGDVLTTIGSIDWADASHAGAVDLVRAKRQPGSTLKPFVYARAFERGVSPMEMLADVPTEYAGGPVSASATSATWSPDNFDGTFVGPVSAREALAGSLNVPAVRLAGEIGARDLVSVLRRVGLPLTEGHERYGLSIALGSGEVTPLELAEAYATLARGGEHVRLRQRTTDPASNADRVLDASAVAAVADALSDPVARIKGLRTRGPFDFPYPVAVKTGTSTAFRDSWTAGFTRERTVVVWTGNPDGAPTRKVTGAVGAGPLFFDVMARAMRDVTGRTALYEPALLEEAEVCPLSGHRVGHSCPDRVRRMFPRGRAPARACDVHQAASPRSVSGASEAPWRCDPNGSSTVVVLPASYRGWLAERPVGASGADAHGFPWLLASQVPGCALPSAEEPRIVVLAPRDGSVLVADRAGGGGHDAVDVSVETRGLPPAEPLEVVVDGRLALRLESPYRARIPVTRGDHMLEVRPADGARAALLGRTQISVR